MVDEAAMAEWFYLCEQIWGCSLAFTTISSGIETTELSEMCTDFEEISPSRSSTPDWSINSSFTGNIEDSS